MFDIDGVHKKENSADAGEVLRRAQQSRAFCSSVDGLAICEILWNRRASCREHGFKSRRGRQLA